MEKYSRLGINGAFARFEALNGEVAYVRFSSIDAVTFHENSVVDIHIRGGEVFASYFGTKAVETLINALEKETVL